MAMTAKEVMRRTIEFKDPDRVALNLGPEHGEDFRFIPLAPGPDDRPAGRGRHIDEWGCEWNNLGVSNLGEVSRPALATWDDFDRLAVPDVEQPERWRHFEGFDGARDDHYCLVSGCSLYERAHYLRGLENLWADIVEEPEKLRRLIGLLVDLNLRLIRRYAPHRPDGFMLLDDWGLQDRLMISPAQWRDLWKPAYAEVFRAAHAAGMHTLLHSCGHIAAILGDWAEIGLDVLQLDQQENMGLDTLAPYAGRLAFWCPADIQTVMGRPDAEIREYVRTLFGRLATPHGGFIAKWYSDPVGAGHADRAVAAMREAFRELRYPAASR